MPPSTPLPPEVLEERAKVVEEIRAELADPSSKLLDDVRPGPKERGGEGRITLHPGYDARSPYQEERLAKIENHIAGLTYSPQVARALSKQYGVDLATIERDAAEATRSLAIKYAYTDDQKKEAREAFLVRNRSFQLLCLKKQAHTTLLRSMELEARVLGLLAPTTSANLNVNVEVPAQPENMSRADLIARAKQLLAKVESE